MQTHIARPFMLLLALVIGLSLTAVACGDDDGGSEEDTATATPGEATEEPLIDIPDVPELEDNTLLIGSDTAYAPIEFYEEGTDNEMGLDVDIANAIVIAVRLVVVGIVWTVIAPVDVPSLSSSPASS